MGSARAGAPATTSKVDAPVSATAPPAQPAPAETRPELVASTRSSAKLLWDKPIYFLIDGEDGRLGALVEEEGVATPYRFEAGKWQQLGLPAKHREAAKALSLGLYFGRDNRPRLMGYHRSDDRMVYLRYRDGAWHDQRSEIGALAGDRAVLFGVLGEDDPEVVCKVGGICLLKSRKGWKELPASIPVTAVVRAFSGRGYALTAEGVLRAGDKRFERVGPEAPWKTPASGFWVGPEETMLVVEPANDLIHAYDGKTWSSAPSPIEQPEDIVQSEHGRIVVGKGGIAQLDGAQAARVGEPSWSFSRVLLQDGRVVAGGASGVAVVELVK